MIAAAPRGPRPDLEEQHAGKEHDCKKADDQPDVDPKSVARAPAVRAEHLRGRDIRRQRVPAGARKLANRGDRRLREGVSLRASRNRNSAEESSTVGSIQCCEPTSTQRSPGDTEPVGGDDDDGCLKLAELRPHEVGVALRLPEHVGVVDEVLLVGDQRDLDRVATLCCGLEMAKEPELQCLRRPIRERRVERFRFQVVARRIAVPCCRRR